MKDWLIKFTEGRVVSNETMLQFSLGFMFACMFFEFLTLFTFQNFSKIFLTIVLISFFGNVKEYFDLKYRKSVFDKTDILSFVSGGTLFLIVKFINEISV